MPRIGREIEQARGIQCDKYCAACGYNLRTQAVVGRCPECGGEYDSRPLGMRGILVPQEVRFPFWDFALFALTAGGGLLLLYAVVAENERWALIPAIVLLAFALMFMLVAGRRAAKWVRYRALIRRLEEGDEND